MGTKLRSAEGQRQDAAGHNHSHSQSRPPRPTPKQNTLGEQLAGQPSAPCSQREPDRNLRLARRAAGQQKVGDVGAGYKQHQAGSGCQQQAGASWSRVPGVNPAARRQHVSLLVGNLVAVISPTVVAPSALLSHC